MEENTKQQVTDITRIAIVGPESTGKTTLARQLAEHFKTSWAPEFARDYLQAKKDDQNEICSPDDLMPIIMGQLELENESLRSANKYLFCDTSSIVTKVFADLYYGAADPAVEKAARKHKYDLFFLTDIDVPWQKDDIRDNPDGRRHAFDTFEENLSQYSKPYVLLSGNEQQRLEKAISAIEEMEAAALIGLNSSDFAQIFRHGLPVTAVARHLKIFKDGIPKTILDRAATRGDGIMRLKDAEFQKYALFFDQNKAGLSLEKFVPASGAASRMFKFLSEFLLDYKREDESINAYINRKNATALPVFLVGLEKFPFYAEVKLKLQKHYSNYITWSSDLRKYYFIKTMLSPKHFDFANKPKAVLPFHKYDGHIATPIEEHLNESCLYCCSDNIANLHFTVTESHRAAFEKILRRVVSPIEEKNSNTINVNFSYQKQQTDTIAVTPENLPMRDEDGRLVFRPGGHGALIENLDALKSDIVFIKNIDNVIHNHIETIALYKKALAGILLELQQKIFSYMKMLEDTGITDRQIAEIVTFADSQLNIAVGSDFGKYTTQHKIEEIRQMLNRPVRVCGMVKNEGEPGGGPFWVIDRKGALSLQIVESSQVNTADPKQQAILNSATHFNPVDIVCGLKNYKGEKFQLTGYIDHNSGFIVEKTKGGKPLKAYELPGLWNGAMAKWITVFVEVPLVTFNPVKTVNDLLKPAHQPL